MPNCDSCIPCFFFCMTAFYFPSLFPILFLPYPTFYPSIFHALKILCKDTLYKHKIYLLTPKHEYTYKLT